MKIDFEDPLDVLFLVSSISFALQLVLTSYYFKTYLTKLSYLKVITKKLALMIVAVLVLTGTVWITVLDDVLLTPDLRETQIIIVGYLLYFGIFMYGMLGYFNEIIVIPDDRRQFLLGINRITRFIILIANLLLAYSIIVYLNSAETDDYFSFIEISLAIIFLISILMFAYFFVQIGKEARITPSKLKKARITLVQFSILTQITGNLVLFLGSLYLGIVTDSAQADAVVEMLMGMMIVLLNLFSLTVLHWSSNIPEWLRLRYDLSVSRFDKIKKLYDID